MVDKVEYDPKDGWRELESRFEVGRPEAKMELLPVDKGGENGALIDMLLLLGAAEFPN